MNPQSLIFIVLIVGVYYFLLIRPRQQENKRMAEMIASLSAGDEIVTIGGIYAKVVSISEDRVRIEVVDGSQLEIAKRAIGRIVEAEQSADEDTVEDEQSSEAPEAPTAPLDAFGPDAGEGGSDDV